MEHDERGRAGTVRGQNVLYVLPEDAAAVSQVIDPVLERVDPDASATQLLVLTADADVAIAVAKAATRAARGTPVRVLPVTGVRRAERLLASRPSPAVAGTPADILELIRNSALKLDDVRTLVLAWVDVILDSGAAESLEAVMAEVPKDAARVVSTSQLSPAVEEIVERYARRPRRVGAETTADVRPVDVRYVTVARAVRPAALRRVLDDLDPDVAAIYARSDEGALEVADTIRGLGYGEHEPSVRLTRGDPVPEATLLVLYELPATPAELRTLIDESAPSLVALVQPRQLAAVRALAAGGQVSAFTLSGPAELARQRQEGARDEIRAALREGAPPREMLTLEPLLREFDGIEIAAAVLRLLEHERERARQAPRPREAEREGAAPGMAQIFVNAGTRDNIGPRELVGAIANEVGVPVDHIGKIDVRDNHTIIEVPTSDVPKITNGLTGITMRGRQLVARPATERPPRERTGGPRGGGAGGRGRERGERGPRDERRGPRGDRRERGDRGDRRERSDRPRFRDRDENPRPPRGPIS